MNKNIIAICKLACGVALLVSCKTVTKSHTADYDFMYITKQGIKQRPLVTDLEVAKSKITFTKAYENVSVIVAKENALGDFVQQNNCDLAVQPFFETNTVSVNEKITITVTLIAYPAYYRNIRNFEPKDTAAFFLNSYYNGTSVPIVAPATESPKATATTVANSIIQKIKSANNAKFGLSANAAMPLGDFADEYNLGVGGAINYLVPLSKQTYFSLSATCLTFSGKEVRFFYPGGSSTIKLNALTNVVTKAGFRYVMPFKIFAEPQIGYSLFDGETGINYGVNVGYNISKKAEFSVMLDNTSLKNSNLSTVGARIGFYF